VEMLLKPLALRAREKGLDLHYDIAPAIPARLRGDATRLRQVLVNLLGNAIKFTARGEVRLRVDLEVETDDAVGLHFTVSDTGIGIPADKQQIIFSAFEQADGSTTRTYGGTGLGLAIASSLVGLMGGRLWLESAVGRGTTFHFTVNLRPANPCSASAEVVRVSALGETKDRPRSRSLRILVAEDNAINQKVIVRILEKRGHQVLVVEDGKQAVDAAERQTFDLVLMDVQMPHLSGFEATRRIRSHEQSTGRRVPILALTAHVLKGDPERCAEAGMDGHVAKPVQPEELFAAIAKQISLGGPPPPEASAMAKQPVLDSRMGRQRHRDGSALPDFAGDGDATAVGVDNRLTDT
jgi:CheY-like chemotaxis protein